MSRHAILSCPRGKSGACKSGGRLRSTLRTSTGGVLWKMILSASGRLEYDYCKIWSEMQTNKKSNFRNLRTGQLSSEGLPNNLKMLHASPMLPRRASNIESLVQKVSGSETSKESGTINAVGVASSSSELMSSSSPSVYKLSSLRDVKNSAMVVPRLHASVANASYEIAPSKSSGARWGLNNESIEQASLQIQEYRRRTLMLHQTTFHPVVPARDLAQFEA